jgi:CheY-specific phosphatase CheX
MIQALQYALADSAASTLESMCFSIPEGNALIEATDLAFGVAVRFEGDFAGTMRLATSQAAARELSASFLGADPDEVSQEGAYSVLLELANIICGATLSSYHKDGHFKLLAPQVVTAGVAPTDSDAVCSLQLEAGPVAAAMTLERDA